MPTCSTIIRTSMSGWRTDRVILLAALTALLAGCDRAPERGSAPEGAAAERVLRVSQRNEPVSLDPATGTMHGDFTSSGTAANDGAEAFTSSGPNDAFPPAVVKQSARARTAWRLSRPCPLVRLRGGTCSSGGCSPRAALSP